MQIKNSGDVTAYVPVDDGGAYTLEPGATVDVRPGTADFAVRNIAGVEYTAEVTLPLQHGIAEAHTEAAIEPLAAFIDENPTARRYSAVGDSPAVPGDVVVVDASTIDPATQAADTTAQPIIVAALPEGETVEVQTAASEAASTSTSSRKR